MKVRQSDNKIQFFVEVMENNKMKIQKIFYSQADAEKYLEAQNENK